MTLNQLTPYLQPSAEAFRLPDWIRPENLIAFKIDDDTMEPEYKKGSIVLVDTSRTIPCDSEYLIEQFEGCYSVKTLQTFAGRSPDPRITIICRNKAYSSQEVRAGDVKVVGKVVVKWEWKP